MDLGKLLEESGAILRGHFILTSGRHSDIYFEKFRVLEQPAVLTALCREIAMHYGDLPIDAVAGPTTGGIIIAFEVARQMGVPAIYVEAESGQKTLRRGKVLPKGHRVLVVDDVLTTGTSLIETTEALRAAGAVVTAYAVLIDRATEHPTLGAPLYSAYKVEAHSYDPHDLPAWLASVPALKPGTRSA